MKKSETGRACGTYGEMRMAYGVSVERPKGKRSLGRPWGR